jgi:hypothetical protein
MLYIPNAQRGATTPGAAFRPTIDEPQTDITVLVTQTHGERVQFLALKVAGVLEPHADKDLQPVRGGEFAENKVRQCNAEAL